MIDVHVLTWEGTDQHLLAQCLASLETEPCTVHVVEGVAGHVGAGRVRGYSCGSNPYVTFVDPDDYILPGVMQACIDGLKEHRSVVTMEKVEVEGVIRSHLKPYHHIAVYPREDITKMFPMFEKTPRFGDAIAREALRPAQLPFVGYVWRILPTGVSRGFNVKEYTEYKKASGL